jgi:hypothetical protein
MNNTVISRSNILKYTMSNNSTKDDEALCLNTCIWPDHIDEYSNPGIKQQNNTYTALILYCLKTQK